MKRIIFLFVFIHIAFFGFTQVKHDYIWSLGEGTKVVVGGTVDSGMDINFNESPISITSMERDIDIHGTTATMSDADGNLLFYTNGCKVFNADHELMENGNNINAGEVNDIQCPDDDIGGAYTVTNGILALPGPGADSLYYLFHQRIVYLVPFDVKIDRLLYSVINMNEDGGKGAIIEKDVTIIADTLWYGDLTAVRHANGEDWWIASFKNLSDTSYMVLLTEDTIMAPQQQKVGLVPEGGEEIGQSCFSPDGTKFVRYNQVDHLYLYDFDRSTGLFSNFQQIMVADTVYSGGVAISPNSRYLYVSILLELYQFDLWAADVAASKILVGTYDGFQDPFATYFYRMQLGPDCRIYMHSGSGHYSWHVINRPDEPGLACDFRQHSFELPYVNFRAMPYFPNYRLGVTPSYPCDSTISVVLTSSLLPEVNVVDLAVQLYPNPVKKGGVLEMELEKGVDGELLLYDILGRVVLSQSVGKGEQRLHVSLGDKIDAGIYFWVLQSGVGKMASGKVMVE